jgi:spectinomycin phosphotransferase
VVTVGGVRATPPEELETSALIAVLTDDWGLDVKAVDYAAVGGGSYHWLVQNLDGTRSFVTADDLDQKPWLGETRESTFDGLRRAFDTAVALRDGGSGFVVAPIPTSRGETVRRVGPRHTIALFPFVDGKAGTFGTYETAERAALLTMLAELHEATPVTASVARRIDLALAGREKLEAALQALDQTWSGGPLSEPARRTLAGNASYVAELLALRDRLSADVAIRSTDWVITHGEPHAGNLMRAGESYMLVDWDTVALAPRERDLWMLIEGPAGEADVYTDATGRQLDEVALTFFRLTWDLADIASFTDLLRSPHDRSADTEKAHEAVIYYVTTRDRWSALLA